MRKRSMVALLALAVACGKKTDRVDSTRPDSTLATAVAPMTSESLAKSPPPPPNPTSGAKTVGTSKSSGGSKSVGSIGAGSMSLPTTDTARGIISVNGSEHDKHTMLAPAGGGRHVEITGPLAVIIGRTGGADVWVTGSKSGTSLTATSFIVRTVDGAPALDGTLKIENGATYLVPVSGTRVRIVNPPPAFQNRDGARVWITGDPARGVASYGFIDPPR